MMLMVLMSVCASMSVQMHTNVQLVSIGISACAEAVQYIPYNLCAWVIYMYIGIGEFMPVSFMDYAIKCLILAIDRKLGICSNLLMMRLSCSLADETD